MKTIQEIFGVFMMCLPLMIKAEVKEIPFTIDDRDRIIRTEQKVEALNAKIDMKFGALDSKIDIKIDGVRSETTSLRSEMTARFDQLFNFLWAIIGIFTTMMVSVFGFAFWDRKLSLALLKK